MVRTLLFLVFLVSPIYAQSEFDGPWDCEIECPGGSIRFGLEIHKPENGKQDAYIINGNEKIFIPGFSNDDADFLISFDHYDSTISGSLENHVLSGTWTKRRGLDEWVKMDFQAQRRSESKSIKPQKSQIDGRWAVEFSKSDDPAVGVFRSGNGNSLSGTFLTTTGDYRYLFGSHQTDKFQLSCFDGAHAFLFKAELSGGKLIGDFWSSNTWHEPWTAIRNEDAKLPDAFKQTKWDENTSLADFSFRDLKGSRVSLSDPKFQAPVKLIYIFGSWCPNCHDAALYFKELKKTYGERLQIVGIAFEHTGNFERDVHQVKKYLKRNEVNYPVLIGGTSNKNKASQAVPFLDRVRSYPTTVFVDSNEKIRGVHTGFTGPATGDAYMNLKTKFKKLIDRVINE